MPKSDYKKLSDQIEIIADEPDKKNSSLLNENSLGLSPYDNEYGAHTLLKLSYLNYYLGIFTTVANSYKIRGKYSKVMFIDAFSGSGLVKIKNTKHTVLGSSILAALNKKIDKVISFEIDPDKAELLSKRLSIISPERYEVICGDVNSEIGKIVDSQITPDTIVLFFVDPEGMEPEFSKLKSLIDKTKFVDIMMNYTWGVYRLEGRINKRFNENDLKRMQKFIPGYLPGNTPDEKLLEVFENYFGKPRGNIVQIKSTPNKTEYSVILRVRKTYNDSKFVDPMVDFGNIISKYNGEDCVSILKTIKGEQSKL